MDYSPYHQFDVRQLMDQFAGGVPEGWNWVDYHRSKMGTSNNPMLDSYMQSNPQYVEQTPSTWGLGGIAQNTNPLSPYLPADGGLNRPTTIRPNTTPQNTNPLSAPVGPDRPNMPEGTPGYNPNNTNALTGGGPQNYGQLSGGYNDIRVPGQTNDLNGLSRNLGNQKSQRSPFNLGAFARRGPRGYQGY
jgi:hypothetical protein